VTQFDFFAAVTLSSSKGDACAIRPRRTQNDCWRFKKSHYEIFKVICFPFPVFGLLFSVYSHVDGLSN